jgi:hypothetical protein
MTAYGVIEEILMTTIIDSLAQAHKQIYMTI